MGLNGAMEKKGRGPGQDDFFKRPPPPLGRYAPPLGGVSQSGVNPNDAFRFPSATAFGEQFARRPASCLLPILFFHLKRLRLRNERQLFTKGNDFFIL